MVDTFEHLPLLFGIEVECFTVLRNDVNNPNASDLDHLERAFAGKGLELRPDSQPDTSNYEQFSITYDGSLRSESTTSDMAKLLNISVDEAAHWHESGIELVSSPLPAPHINTPSHALDQPIHRAQLREYINALRSGKHHRSFTTAQCGLHLHFGIEGGKQLPLPVLQYLTLILLVYEPIISSLHHHSRTPYHERHAAQYCKSNRTAFLVDGHTCHDDGSKIFDMTMAKNRIFEHGMTATYLAGMMGSDELLDLEGKEIPPVDWECCPQNLEERERRMEDRARECKWEGQTIAALNVIVNRHHESKVPEKEKNLGLSTRYKITNWSLISGYDSFRPQTIEFRQPPGTLDTAEIGNTIQLYTALVRAAERLAAGVEELEVVEEPDLNSLLRLLQLSRPAHGYWHDRAGKMAEERRLAGLDEGTLTPAQKCQLCSRSEDGTYESRKKFEKECLDRAKEQAVREQAGEASWAEKDPWGTASNDTPSLDWPEQAQEKDQGKEQEYVMVRPLPRSDVGHSDTEDDESWSSGLVVPGVEW